MLKPSCKNSHTLLLALAVAVAALTSCVDHDYDLSKDIDMNATFGGQELHLPVSSTDVLTMQQILDIDPESSSIKVASQGEYGLNAGDYVLVQKGSESTSSVKVERVSLDNLSGDRTATPLEFPMTAAQAEVIVPTNDILSNLTIEDNNVNTDLKSLSAADTDLELTVDVTYSSSTFSGTTRIKSGFTATFDPKWTVEIADAATRNFAEMADSHTLRFTRDVDFTANKGFTIRVKVSRFSGLTAQEGNGLYAEGKFKLNSSIVYNGDMALLNTNSQSGLEKVTLNTYSQVTRALLLSVTGRVDPDITVNPTTVEITDIPDFLSEQGNELDLANPMININVDNTSPLGATVNATLVAYSKNGTATVNIGQKYGTAPIYINPNGHTVVTLSRTGANGAIAVPDLADLLTTVPDRIEITNVEAAADQTKEVTFILGDGADYTFRSSYEAVVPFAFGPKLRFTYSDEDSGWEDDLDDYSFNRVNITTTVYNSSPLTLAPTVVALDANGNEITDVVADIQGTVAGGSLSAPSTSPLTIALISTSKNISNLHGVRFSFEATVDHAHVNENLNQNQSIRFDEIAVSIIGGVTIDLNDK